MGRVEGKVCIVTGGAMGLGEADCRLLAGEGGRVIVADIADQKGRELAEEIGAEFYHLDVTIENAWVDLMAHVKDRYGKLNVLVNNAGIAIFAHVENTTEEAWRKVNAVCSDSVFFGMKHAIPLMRASGEPCSIINISSIAGIAGTPYVFSYAAAKGAVRLMSKAAAVHCAQNGDSIRVNSVHPGAIETPMTTGAHPPDKSAPEIDGIAQRVSEYRQGSRVGEPDDIGFMVLYLASDESKFVSGAEMIVDNTVTVTEGVVP